ncbi:MAG: WD40 repeat domain-containing protein [Anaerolineales bacterium]
MAIAWRLVEFSPGGDLLATTPSAYGDDHQVYIYNAEAGHLLRQWEGQRAVFSPHGLVAVERDGAVRVMDIEKGTALQAFNGKSAAFSADGQSLALLDGDTIRLYHVADGSLLKDMEGGYETVYKLQFAPDGQTLAIVGDVPMCPNCLTTPQAALWQISDGSRTVLDVQDPLGLTYAPREGYLVIWAIASINILNPADASPVAVFDEYATGVNGIAFSPEGRILAANSGNPHLSTRLWRVADSRLVNLFEDPLNPGYGDSKTLFSPDGRILWAQGGFWGTADGKRLTPLENRLAAKAPPYIPASVSFSPDGQTMAIGYLEGHLQLWDLGEEKLVRKLEGYQGEVVDLAFSSGGKTLAAAYAYPDYTIQFWKMPQGERLLAIKGVEWTHEFSQVVFSPDGQTLLSVAKYEDGMDLGVLELWRASDGERLYQLEASGILSAAFSSDGQLIATGSYDHTVRLWQTSDGKLLKILRGHGDYVTDLAFSPSGELLASGSNEGTVILWGIPGDP